MVQLMTEDEFPRLLKHLQRRIRDCEFRSAALEALLKQPWDAMSYDSCVRFCVHVARIQRARFYERVYMWGQRTTMPKNKVLSVPNVQMRVRQNNNRSYSAAEMHNGRIPITTEDQLTPLRRVLLMEELGVL